MANGCVAAIRKGCELYKDVKGTIAAAQNLPDFTKWTTQASKWITDAILGTGTEENPGLVVRLAQLARGLTTAADQNQDGFRTAGSQIGGYLVQGLLNTFTSYISDSLRNYFTWENLKTIIFRGGNPFNLVGSFMGQLILDGLLESLKDLAQWIYNTIWNAARRGIGDAFGGFGGFLGGLLGRSAAIDENAIPKNPGYMGGTVFNATINVYGPPGAEGGDIASWIVRELQEWVSRNGKPAGLWS